jgi:RNA polymerase sigma-70 factor (ECF subfamily)
MNDQSDRKKETGLAAACRACRAALARAVSRIVKRHDIEDILQDAFIRSVEPEGRYRICNPRAFLLRRATSLALSHAAAARCLEKPADGDSRFQEFCGAVGGLPEQCRRAFILKKVYGLSTKEIGLQLGIGESAAEKRVADGLLLCRAALDCAPYGVPTQSSARVRSA